MRETLSIHQPQIWSENPPCVKERGEKKKTIEENPHQEHTNSKVTVRKGSLMKITTVTLYSLTHHSDLILSSKKKFFFFFKITPTFFLQYFRPLKASNQATIGQPKMNKVEETSNMSSNMAEPDQLISKLLQLYKMPNNTKNEILQCFRTTISNN